MKRQMIFAGSLLCLLLLHAVPATADSECSLAFNMRSVDPGPATSIVFVNSGTAPLALIWIDLNGGRVPYATISPGGNVTQQTFVNHVWLIQDSTKKCRGVYAGQDKPRTVTVK